ncbi:MAG TPA: adenylate/guanylate cyclase domain-containing protein [Methylomirabilota bacterium]|nr:adenylate/guanylate cyclase domain-containing protein [Methylomirabilota bacterium]
MTALSTALVTAGTGLTVLVWAVRARWFARLHAGFLVVLMVTLAAVGLAAASLYGLYATETGRVVLLDAVVRGMQNLGTVVEQEIHEEVERARRRLARLGEEITPDTARARPREVIETLHGILRFDVRFLQIAVLDDQGAPVVSASSVDGTEPIDRVAVAWSLEGKPFVSQPQVSPVFRKYVLVLAVPIHAPDRGVRGAITARWDLQEDLRSLLDTTRFNRTGYTALTDHRGRILAHPDAARVGEDAGTQPAVMQALQGRSGWLVAPAEGGPERLFAYRPVASPATIEPKPWILLTEEAVDDALAPVHALAQRFALALAVVVIGCVALAALIAPAIRRPVADLLAFARRLGQGALDARMALEGRDEVGRLAAALNEMAAGLQERERVKEIFGRYVTTQVSEEVLRGELRLGGERRRVTLLFSDIRNFTTMSEGMAPEEVVGFLNDYFTEMVEAVFEQHGVLDKFIGDGIMATFGALDRSPDHPARAARAALRMQALLAKINGERAMTGKPPFGIGIGIHTDEVVVGNIGSRRRMEYTAIGDGVNTCARVEAANKELGTTILVTETTCAEIRDAFDCRPMPDLPLKGKSKVPRLFELVSLKSR